MAHRQGRRTQHCSSRRTCSSLRKKFHRLHTDTCVSEFLQGWKLLLLLLVVHMHALLFLLGKVQAGLWWLPRTVRTCRPVKTVDRTACSLSAWQTARFHIFAGKRWGQVRVGRLWLQEMDDDDQTCHTSVRNKVHKRIFLGCKCSRFRGQSMNTAGSSFFSPIDEVDVMEKD
ncbi:uncharacterized protein LOC127776617 isoform X2 [Oryza glaberrima]|uniref:uncharacterized protein LOC127776617 isoform X2 n=1 Tax=Oryza glaberrima TaxID=4538 RepID=UPI00224C6142|nr:uncharacterized protein LOC127776617 isoform X2 [Oryza glaberrima]